MVETNEKTCSLRKQHLKRSNEKTCSLKQPMTEPSEKACSLRLRQNRGQMTVELAVCLPVILAVMGIVLNVLGYMNVCARFDRVAADAVRSQATSPGYGEEGSTLAASRVREVIDSSLHSSIGDGFNCKLEVSAIHVGLGGLNSSSGSNDLNSANSVNGSGASFSLLSGLVRYECSITYYPWPFSQIVFMQFFELTHTRSYTVDPFSPGVLL